MLGVCSDDREVLVELRRRAPAMPRWWSLPAVPCSRPEWAGAVAEVLAQRRGLRGLVPPLTDLGTLARDRPLCREDLLHLAAIPTRRWLPTQLPRLSADVAPAGVAVAHGAITPALCAAAERLGLLMAAWTVNRAGLARQGHALWGPDHHQRSGGAPCPLRHLAPLRLGHSRQRFASPVLNLLLASG